MILIVAEHANGAAESYPLLGGEEPVSLLLIDAADANVDPAVHVVEGSGVAMLMIVPGLSIVATVHTTWVPLRGRGLGYCRKRGTEEYTTIRHPVHFR